MDDQEVKIEEALELYYRAAEEFNSLLGGSVPYEVVRDLRVSALLVLQGYRHKDNWNDRRPIITIPPEMALDLAEDIDSVLRGQHSFLDASYAKAWRAQTLPRNDARH